LPEEWATQRQAGDEISLFLGDIAAAPHIFTLKGSTLKFCQAEHLMMNTDSRDNRRRLAISAGAWALLVGFLIAVGASLSGFDATEVVETAVLGALGAAVCILFFAGDILALADRLNQRRGRRS
jgi:hypothetical protein